jgi:hypothetical protein
MIEITDIRVLLPALVTFKQNNEELSVFAYVDQLKKDIVLPDASEIIDVDEFKTAFAAFYNSKNKANKIPPLPKSAMEKVDPEQFKR